MKSTLSKRTILILPILLLILLVGISPFGTAFWDSFHHDYYGERSFAGLDNFRFILGDAAFGYSLNITVIWAILNVILSLFFGFLLALRLLKKDSPQAMLHRFLLIPWGIPVYIAIPLWRAFLHGNGGESVITKLTGLQINLMMDPLSGFLSALLVSLWLSIPLSAFVFAGHMRKVSRQVIEAARIDGAGEGEIAFYIYLPEIRESLLAMGVLNFIKAFKEFTLVFMMTAGGPPMVSGITNRYIVGATTTLGVFLYEVFLQTNDWGINAAYALIMAVFVIIFIGIWVLIKRGTAIRPFLIVSALILIPGGNPALWIIASAYLGIFLIWMKKKETTKMMFSVLVFFHTGFILFRIINLGFLQGFHPGVFIPLMVWIVQKLKGDRQFKPHLKAHKGLTAVSKITTIIYVLLTLIILYMLLWMSLSGVSACYIDGPLPSHPTIRNFITIFTDEGILSYFFNTFIVAGITALLLPIVIFPGAVYLHGAGRRKTMLFLGLVQIIAIAGGMHSLIPLYRIFRSMNLLNTYIPLILIYLNHAIPLSLFILTAYLETLPSSFRDQAKIEGMSDSAYGFKILLPLAKPPLITVIMTAFIAGWNGFQAPLLFLNEEELYTISLKLYSYVGNLGSGTPVWNLFAAASVINTLFIGILFIRFKNPMEQTAAGDVED